ncbi:hypothetical protein [Vitiosangium sp. GDMCC 1.1324]|uniref:hypothetical protein n=1 Tax=Vitiosangium sp. (strain GDMCC 1.1324) TaxID=2138576 RepID=UPI000D34D1E8|nr:hypothetical protein [Vitiosangium sp. GDMCC 1.1324]PTL82573.1 hypothetical protein DAT35_17385 [Vitiosangium sp. GDMCC 1.1324]
MDVPASLQDFSLLQGGPFLLLRRRFHLLRPGRPTLRWRLLALTLLGWLPLLLLTAVRGEPAALRAFLLDYHVHTQLLISLPVLIAAERYVDKRLALAVRQLVSSELIEAENLSALDDAARKAQRLRSLGLVEAGLLLVSYMLSFWQQLPKQHVEWLFADGEGHLTPAGLWYVAGSLPLFRFMVLWWLWRGAVWALFLFRVSRMPLALRPTHPDFTGGLRFLSTCQSSFSVVVFALACASASATRHLNRVSPTEDPLRYASPQLVLALIAFILVFAPLLPFGIPLLRAKRRGVLQFSALAAHHSRDFERRWFDPQGGPQGAPGNSERPLLGAAEFSSLADLGTSFDVTHRMRLIPWGRRPLLSVAAAALAPLVPLLIVDRQFLALVLQLIQNLL